MLFLMSPNFRVAFLMKPVGVKCTVTEFVAAMGVRFQFELLVTEREEHEAVYIQDQLREIGVQMDIARRSEWVQVFQQIREGEFEAVITRVSHGATHYDGSAPFLWRRRQLHRLSE